MLQNTYGDQRTTLWGSLLPPLCGFQGSYSGQQAGAAGFNLLSHRSGPNDFFLRDFHVVCVD